MFILIGINPKKISGIQKINPGQWRLSLIRSATAVSQISVPQYEDRHQNAVLQFYIVAADHPENFNVLNCNETLKNFLSNNEQLTWIFSSKN
jgi:hypothetical protein